MSADEHTERLVMEQTAADVVGPAHVRRRCIPQIWLVLFVAHVKIWETQSCQVPDLLSPSARALAPIRQNANGQIRVTGCRVSQGLGDLIVGERERHDVKVDLARLGQGRSFGDEGQQTAAESIASEEAGK
jgi:hypothetical protein